MERAAAATKYEIVDLYSVAVSAIGDGQHRTSGSGHEDPPLRYRLQRAHTRGGFWSGARRPRMGRGPSSGTVSLNTSVRRLHHRWRDLYLVEPRFGFRSI